MKSLVEETLERQQRARNDSYGHTRLELKPLRGRIVRLTGSISNYVKNKKATTVVLTNIMVNDSIPVDHMKILIPHNNAITVHTLTYAIKHKKPLSIKGKLDLYKRKKSNISSYHLQNIHDVSIPNMRTKLDKIKFLIEPGYNHIQTLKTVDSNIFGVKRQFNKPITHHNKPGFINDLTCQTLDLYIANATHHPNRYNLIYKTLGRIQIKTKTSQALTHFAILSLYRELFNIRPMMTDPIHKEDFEEQTNKVIAQLAKSKPLYTNKWLDAHLFFEDEATNALILVMSHIDGRLNGFILETLTKEFPQYNNYIWLNPLRQSTYTLDL